MFGKKKEKPRRYKCCETCMYNFTVTNIAFISRICVKHSASLEFLTLRVCDKWEQRTKGKFNFREVTEDNKEYIDTF